MAIKYVDIISGNRFLTSENPTFAASLFSDEGRNALFMQFDAAMTIGISIYNIGLQQYWNGNAYQAAFVSVPMTQLVDGQGATRAVFTYSGLTLAATPEKFFIRVDVRDAAGVAGNAQLSDDPMAVQLVETSLSLTDMPVADAAFAAGDDVTTLGQLLSVLKLVNYNNQRVDDLAKKLIHYKNDDVTPGLSFNLKDAQGNLSAREVFRKEIS